MEESRQTAGPHGNLADPATSFVDRVDEVAELRESVAGGGQSVALVGPPGAGKSRLAIEAAWELKPDDFPGGAWMVDVSNCTCAADVLLAIASTLDVPWEKADDADAFLRGLGRRGAQVVILDAFDRLVDSDASDLFAAWRRRCPESTLIVTSRTRVPDARQTIAVPPLSTDDAIELFSSRSGVSAERDLVRELVEHLDRLPLAVELAASRAPILGPADLLDHLDQRFDLLRERGEERALERAVEWSWEALGDSERRLLVQTSVFAAPFSIDDVEVVWTPDDDAWVVDIIASLVDRSLLRRTSLEVGKARFSHYESVRAYATARPEAGDLLDRARERYRSHFSELPGRLAGKLETEHAAAAVAEVETSLPELLAVFEAALKNHPDRAVDLAISLARFLERSARGAVLMSLLDAAMEVADEPRRLTSLQTTRGELRIAGGDLDAAASDLAEASRTARRAAAREFEAYATFRLGDVERRRGHPEEAMMLLGQALEFAENSDDDAFARLVSAHLACCRVDLADDERARALIAAVQMLPPHPDPRREAEILKRLSYAQFYLGNYEEQHRLGKRALDHARGAADRRLEALCIHGLGDSALQLERRDEARNYYEHALEMHRGLGDQHYEGILLGNLGSLHHQADRSSEAGECYREALEIHRRTGATPYEAVVSFALGVLEVERGRLDEAEHHYGVALELNDGLDLHDDVGAVEMARAWVALERGEEEAAVRRLDAAVLAFERSEDHAWRAIAAMARDVVGTSVAEPATARAIIVREGGEAEAALLELLELVAEVRAGGAGAEKARARLAEIGADPDGELSAARWSLHVRALHRAARRMGAGQPPRSAGQRTDGRVLLVATNGEWFEIGGERVDLRRRRSLRLLLLELARRAQTDGEGLDVYDAFDVGWPGEKATVEAAADRVYWAIGTLRKLGLEDAIVTTDDGYHLDPGFEIEVAEA